MTCLDVPWLFASRYFYFVQSQPLRDVVLVAWFARLSLCYFILLQHELILCTKPTLCTRPLDITITLLLMEIEMFLEHFCTVKPVQQIPQMHLSWSNYWWPNKEQQTRVLVLERLNPMTYSHSSVALIKAAQIPTHSDTIFRLFITSSCCYYYRVTIFQGSINSELTPAPRKKMSCWTNLVILTLQFQNGHHYEHNITDHNDRRVTSFTCLHYHETQANTSTLPRVPTLSAVDAISPVPAPPLGQMSTPGC